MSHKSVNLLLQECPYNLSEYNTKHQQTLLLRNIKCTTQIIRGKSNLSNESGENFSNWKFRLKLILQEKQVYNALSDESDTKDYLQNDVKARSIIVHCLHDKYLEIVKNYKTAKEMIVKLEERFERKSVANKLYLKRKLINLKCNGEKL